MISKEVLFLRRLSISLLRVATLVLAITTAAERFDGEGKRPVTVADSICMTTLGDPSYFEGGPISDNLAKFSTDGKSFVIVLRKGNLEQNTNEFSLLLWRTGEVFNSPTPKVLVKMVSNSNRQAIADVKWIDDETLSFLGEHPDESRQVYTFNIRTRVLEKLTNQSTSVISYSITPKGKQLAYLVERPTEKIWDSDTRRRGFVVSTEWAWNLVRGQLASDYIRYVQLVFQTPGGASHSIDTSDAYTAYAYDDVLHAKKQPYISPDGRYIVMALSVGDMPTTWKEYADRMVSRMAIGQKTGSRLPLSLVQRYMLIDTRTGESRVLLNAPIASISRSKVAWSPDGRSVVITHTYLPLDNSEGEERKRRRSKSYAVEVKIPSGDYATVGGRDVEPLMLIRWDSNPRQLVFQASPASEEPKPGAKVVFRKIGETWEKVTNAESEEGLPAIVLAEDMNTPPKIFALNSDTHNMSLLLDLNPRFSQLQFGRVENIRFKDPDGHERTGGLYYPVDYEAGKRYPLVIQTHGSPNQRRFLIDGIFTSAFAAQPLAGKGMMVLQMNEVDTNAQMTSRDGPQAEVGYEGAIDYLDGRRLINRDRVGIIGFSQTCYYVKYTLTHSTYKFAAASVQDGYDAGYFGYVLNGPPGWAQFEAENGALPFGEGLKLWIKNSPGFNLDKVRTPLLITSPRPDSVLNDWEWFTSLTRLSKPVELVLLQDGSHLLQKPWDRMTSQQGNVDWFSFWLKGEEDPDSVKAEQYKRWRELRKLQEKNEATRNGLKQ